MRCEARYPFRMARDLSLTGLLTTRLARVVRGVQAVKIRSSAVGSLDAFALGLDSPFVCVVPTTRVPPLWGHRGFELYYATAPPLAGVTTA